MLLLTSTQWKGGFNISWVISLIHEATVLYYWGFMLKRDNVEKKFVLYFYYCHAIPIAVPVRFLVNMY